MKRRLVTKRGEAAVELDDDSPPREAGVVKVTRSGKVLTGVPGLGPSENVPVPIIKSKLPVIKTRVIAPSSSRSATFSSPSSSSPSASSSRKSSGVSDLKLQVVRAVDGRRVVRAEPGRGKQKDTEREKKKRLIVERIGQEKSTTKEQEGRGTTKKEEIKSTTITNHKREEEQPKRRKLIVSRAEEVEEMSQQENESASVSNEEQEEEEEEVKKPRVIQRAMGRAMAITIRNAQEQGTDDDDEEQEGQESEVEVVESEPEEVRKPSRGHRTAVLSSKLLNSESEVQSGSDEDSDLASTSKGVSKISTRWKAHSRESSGSRSPPRRTIKSASNQADNEEILGSKPPRSSANNNEEPIRSKKVSGKERKKVEMFEDQPKTGKSNEEQELHAVVVSHERALAKFMRTKSEPHVFFAPATPCSRSRAWQIKCEKDALARIVLLDQA